MPGISPPTITARLSETLDQAFREGLAPGAEHNPEEFRVVDEIAPGQPARLVQQAEEPLHAHARDPARRPGHAAGEKVERAPDAHQHRRPQPGAVALDEELLL